MAHLSANLAAAAVMSLLFFASLFPQTKALAAFPTLTSHTAFSRQQITGSSLRNRRRIYSSARSHFSSSATCSQIMSSSKSNDEQSPTAATPLSISSRTLQTLDPCVVLMKQIISQHASKWEDDPQGIFSLAQGVVHWRPPNSAYEALSKAVQENIIAETSPDKNDGGYGMDGAIGGGDGSLIHTYCPDEGYPPLLAALKEKLQNENGLHNPHVMVTSGANQAYINCILTLLDESDEMGNISKCVVFEPYYFNHVMAVQSTRGGRSCGGINNNAYDAKSVEGLLVGPTSEGVPDLAWLRSQLEEHRYTGNGGAGNNAIRMVTLVNPGNPTGVSLPHEFLEEITQLTKEYGVWLVMDNTYEHFDVEGKNKLPDGDNNGDAPEYPCFDEEHVINIFSFSKGYAMAGFRVGYIALSSKKYGDSSTTDGRGTKAYEEMLKVQDTIAICTSRISQMAALGALEAGREWVYEQVKTLDTGRKVILEAIESLEEVIGGSGAMYVMGKLPDGIDDQEFASSLVEHYGVAVIPGSFCGLPGWIRVCYSNLPPEECKIAATRLKRGILELTAKQC